jgi:hypothetical protein
MQSNVSGNFIFLGDGPIKVASCNKTENASGLVLGPYNLPYAL